MANKILIGKNGTEHGIWVAKPGQSVEQGGPYLMSSVADMLKIHAQNSILSQGIYQPAGEPGKNYRHNITVSFPELPFIPLAFMGAVKSESEPFQFPPDLRDMAISRYWDSTWGVIDYMPAIGVNHKELKYAAWSSSEYIRFNYTVFLTKIRDKF